MAVTSDERARLLRRVTLASVGLALFLVIAKAVAWSMTGSIAVLASLVDSALDAGASLINLFAVRLALKPADDGHRFGHGKSEALAGLAQALLIALSATYVIAHALERIGQPQPLSAIPIGVAVMVLSIALTLALVVYQRRVIRVTRSSAIAADSLHYAGDLASNASTLLALWLAGFGFTRLDALFAFAIATSTIYGALRIGWDTFQVLMDHELPAAVREQVRSIAMAHEQVVGVHDLRTRQSGPTTLIQFHLEMDGRLSLHDAHRIADEVESALLQAFPNADVVIHQDPAGVGEARQLR